MKSRSISLKSGRRVHVRYRKVAPILRYLESGVMAVQPEEAGVTREQIDQAMRQFVKRTRD